MVIDYDPPVKKLSEEFVPHHKVALYLYFLVCVKILSNRFLTVVKKFTPS